MIQIGWTGGIRIKEFTAFMMAWFGHLNAAEWSKSKVLLMKMENLSLSSLTKSIS